MTDSNYSHILAIVDRSGSMMDCDTEMRNALNMFFDEQAKVDGKCLVDYVQFDTEYEKVFEDRPVAEARAVLEPRGLTALLDAIGRGSTELGTKLAALPEVHRPGKVLVAVVTDGYENASREWTASKVKELVQRQESEYDWDFVFLGANMDAVSVGAGFGFKADKSLTFNTQNVGASMASLSNYTTEYRAKGAASFTDEDRAAQKV